MNEIFFLILGGSGVIAILLGLLISRSPKVSPVHSVNNDEQQKAEKEEAVKDQTAQETHDKTVEEAKEEETRVNEDLIDTLRVRRDDLLNDPEALNENLKDVGKQVRGS